MRSPAEWLSGYRPVLPLYGGIFFSLLGIGASLATVPFFVLRRLHGGNVAAGLAVAMLSVAVVVARPAAGRLADRHGYKLVMICGTVICLLAGLAYYGAANLGLLIAVRVLHGVGEGTVYTAGAAWLVSISPASRRGRVVGLYGISMWSGITLGTLIGTVAMRTGGFAAVWAFCAAAAVAGMACVAAGHKPEHVPATDQPASGQPASGGRGGYLLPRAAVVPGLAVALAALGYAALASFVSLHMQARGVANGIAAFDAFGVTYIGIRLFFGGVSDKYSPRTVAFWSAIVETAGLVVVGLAGSLVTVIIGGLIMGTGLSLLFPSLAVIVIERTRDSRRGVALGAFTSFWDLGIAVGAPLSGLIANLTNYTDIYYVMAVCAVGSALLAAPEQLRRRSAPASASAPTGPEAEDEVVPADSGEPRP
jgi:MFS family permease